MRKRTKLVFLFPVFVLIFIIGWTLYVIGDRRHGKNFATSQEGDLNPNETNANSSEVEMGLVGKVVEEYLED